MELDESSRQVFAEMTEKRLPVFLNIPALAMTFETRVLSLDTSGVRIANRIPPQMIRRAVQADKFSLQCGTHRFESTRIGTDGVDIVFPFASVRAVAETRQAERFSFTKDENVICSFINPFDDETQISRPVIDMSASGLSLAINVDSDLFSPGVVFSNLSILIDGKPYTKANGQVVYKRKLMNWKGDLRLQVGLRFV